MGTSLASGLELTLVVATAVTVSLAGMWLTRRTASPAGAHRAAAPSSHRLPSAPASPARSAQSPINNRPAIRSASGRQASTPTGSTAWGAIVFGLGEAMARPAEWLQAARKKLQSFAAPRGKVRAKSAEIRTTANPAEALPARLSIDTQWDRAAHTIGRAVDATHSLRTTHSKAADKLDAAHYALERLMSELEGVLTVKPAAQVAILPRTANVVSMRYARPAAARVAA